MGLFERDGSKGEVRIEASERTKNSKLKEEAEARLGKGETEKDSYDTGSSSVSNEELYEQNKRIIDLLEQLVDEETETQTNDNEGAAGGMDGLL